MNQPASNRRKRTSFLCAATIVAGSLMLGGCANNTQSGAAGGAILGAIGGAIIGHQSGQGGEGAAIGAAAGALIGGAAGNAKDEQYRHRRYNY